MFLKQTEFSVWPPLMRQQLICQVPPYWLTLYAQPSTHEKKVFHENGPAEEKKTFLDLAKNQFLGGINELLFYENPCRHIKQTPCEDNKRRKVSHFTQEIFSRWPPPPLPPPLLVREQKAICSWFSAISLPPEKRRNSAFLLGLNKDT